MERITANTKKLASIAVLPELRNGDTTPDSGITPSTPPVINNISNANRLAKPSAKNNAYSFAASLAIQNIRRTKNVNSRPITAIPAKPHSSPMAGKTRSVWPAGINAGSPHPGPEPHRPPVDNAQIECAS